MEDYKPETEMEGETKTNLQYNCTECRALVDIISLNENLDEIKFRCLNAVPHKNQMRLSDYLDNIISYYCLEMVPKECEKHKKCDYEFYCLNCNKHLCKECIESRDHLYHVRINIITEFALTKEEDALIQKFIGYNKKENNNNQKDIRERYNGKFKEIKELIYIVYDYYVNNKNNYFLAANLFKIIICCCKNNKELKMELGFTEDQLNKLMKLDNNIFVDNFEKELKSLEDVFNKKVDNLTIEKIILEKKKQYTDGTYIGEFKEGLRNGRGRFEFNNGDKYEGEWKNDKKEGKGILFFKDGNKYEGDFKNDTQDGKGILLYGTGEYAGNKYEGDFKNGKTNGNGIYWFSNGERQMGNFEEGKAVGNHALITNNDEIVKIDFS